MEKRIIKFRYWDSFNGVMQYCTDDKKYLLKLFIWYDNAQQGGNNPILMQYTGLKDKEGKEIYEGDVLKVFEEDGEERIASVVWGDKYPAFTLDPESDVEYNELQHACLVVTCEVLGNLYEHPHLMKQEIK